MATDPLTLDLAAKDAFWRVVEECLSRFHRFDALRSIQEARALRQQFEAPPLDVAGDLIYHDEPFYVACEIAGLHDPKEQDRMLNQNRATYDTILSQHGW